MITRLDTKKARHTRRPPKAAIALRSKSASAISRSTGPNAGVGGLSQGSVEAGGADGGTRPALLDHTPHLIALKADTLTDLLANEPGLWAVSKKSRRSSIFNVLALSVANGEAARQ